MVRTCGICQRALRQGACPVHGHAPTAKVEAKPFWEEDADVSRGEITREVTAEVELTPGTRLGEYLLGEPLGQGGEGLVYSARDARGRARALKVLNESGDEAALRAEAKLLLQVRHRNVLEVERFVEDGRRSFLVMEQVQGESLDDRLRAADRLTWAEFEPLFTQGLRALEAIHRVGFIHRDVKPANLLLAEDGRLVLIDFGTARDGAERGPIPPTRSRLVRGTLEYMSPEQLTGSALDARTDLFSFGCVAWRVLAGKLPWPGKALATARARTSREADALPAGLAPKSVASLLARLLARSADERPASASEVLAMKLR